MPLDEMTRRNLELVESLRGGSTEGTLLSVLDRTKTPMGARLLRQWLLAPLVERTAIEARLDAVAALVRDASARDALRSALDGVRDAERLGGKAAAGRATPREVASLGASLARLPDVERAVRPLGGAGVIGTLMTRWDDCAEMATRVLDTLVERPPLQLGEEATIAPGVDAELDQLRALRDGGKDAVARIQAEERARTGIASLKVGYNKVFGYFIEISNANRHLVPARLPAPTDAHRRRAVRDTRAQGIRGADPHGRGANRDARARALRGAARGGRAGDRAHPVRGAHRRRAGCAGGARGRRGARRLRAARR